MSRRVVLAGVVAAPWVLRQREGVAALPPLDEVVLVADRTRPIVTLLRTADAAIVATVPLPAPAWQLALVPGSGILLASDRDSRTITALEIAAGRTLWQLELDHEPEHMQLDPSGRLLAVSNFYQDRIGLVALDRPVWRDIAGLPRPHNFVFAGDGRTLAVATMGQDAVALVDLATATRRAVIPVDLPGLRHEPSWRDQGHVGMTDLTVTPERRFAVVVPVQGTELAVVDLEAKHQVDGIEVGDTPWRVYGASTGRRFAVPNVGDGTVSLIGSEGWRETARLAGGGDMTWALFAWFDQGLYVNDRATRSLLVIDADRGEPSGRIELPGSPEAGLLDPAGGRLVVALPDAGEIALIDPRRAELVARVAVGGEPHALAAKGSLNYCN
jgi:DNA-binding beta-propeller fold protein YncE